MTKRRTEFKIEDFKVFVAFCNARATKKMPPAKAAYAIVKRTFPHLKRVEDHVRSVATAFDVNGVTGRKYEPDPRCLSLLRRFQRMISDFDDIDNAPLRDIISVAGSPSLISHFGTEVVRQFYIDKRKDDPAFADRFEFHVAQGLPHELIRNALCSMEYDLVITSCNRPDTIFKPDDFEWKHLDLPMYLMFDRRHPLADQEPSDLTWESLSELTVIIQDENRDPRPPYPEELFASACRKVRVPCYQDAYATVLCNGTTACVGFPQLLTPSQRVRLKSVSNNHLKLQNMPVVVLRRREHGRHPGQGREGIVKELFERFHTRLADPIAGGIVRDFRHVLGPHMRTTWNVGQDKSHRYVWKKGLIKNLEVTPAGEFNADHVIELFEHQPEEFSIEGRITEDGNGEYQITWNGSKRFTTSPDENYQAIIIAGRAEMSQGPLYGRWMGRTSANLDYREDMGFFVLVANDWPGSPADLESDCRKRFGRLEWRYPAASEPAKDAVRKRATAQRREKNRPPPDSSR